MAGISDTKTLLCILWAIFVVYGKELDCKKKYVNLCLGDREKAYIELCRANDADGSRYDYESGIECLENVLSYCPKGKRSAAEAETRQGIQRLKTCVAADRCISGEEVLARLDTCDVEYSQKASTEFCKLAQDDINCQAVSSRACPEIYSILWPMWNSTKADIRFRCQDLVLPAAGSIPEVVRSKRESEKEPSLKDDPAEATQETKEVCKKKEVKACVDNRKFEYLELCKHEADDGSRYDYDKAITCASDVLSSCRTKYKAIVSQASEVITKFKVCKEANECVNGEHVLENLQACDRKFLEFSKNKHRPKAYTNEELCKKTQEEIECQAAWSLECPGIHTILWDTWHTTAIEVYTRCKLLKLPDRYGNGNGGLVHTTSSVSLLMVALLVTLRVFCY